MVVGKSRGSGAAARGAARRADGAPRRADDAPRRADDARRRADDALPDPPDSRRRTARRLARRRARALEARGGRTSIETGRLAVTPARSLGVLGPVAPVVVTELLNRKGAHESFMRTVGYVRELRRCNEVAHLVVEPAAPPSPGVTNRFPYRDIRFAVARTALEYREASRLVQGRMRGHRDGIAHLLCAANIRATRPGGVQRVGGSQRRSSGRDDVSHRRLSGPPPGLCPRPITTRSVNLRSVRVETVTETRVDDGLRTDAGLKLGE